MKVFKFLILLLFIVCEVKISFAQNNNSKIFSTSDVIVYDLQNVNANPPHKIYSINIDGTENELLIPANNDLNHFNFSSDGNYLATTGYISGMDGSTWSIYIYNFSTATLQRVTNTSNVWDGDPAYSPNGSLITFTRTFPASGRNEIWILNSDGTNLHYLGVLGFQPKFSPDGTKLAYASITSGNWEIYICNADGTGAQKLTNNTSNEFAPVWSPDGSKLVFHSDRDGNSEIYVMKSDGTQMQRLTNDPAYDAQAKWSPDGSQIAFHSDRLGSGRYQIFVMNSDGSNVRQVTNVVYPDQAINPTWKPKPITSINDKSGYNVPTDFKLFQNYPNPFNPSTTIQFALNKTSLVKLKVYDLLGRQIKNILNEERTAGIHSVVWDGKDNFNRQISGGVYLCKLDATDIDKANNFSQTMKMILLK